MNKNHFQFITIALGIIALTFGNAYAQKSIEIVAAERYIEHDLREKIDLQTGAIIKNASNQTKSFKVKRVDGNSELPQGHITYFCWDQCYGPSVTESPTAITLAPGESTDKFKHDIVTDSIPGIGKVAYYFYDVNNPSDSTHLLLTYRAYNQDGTGIKKYSLPAVSIYPNPSNSAVFVSNIIEGGTLQITDITGRIVKIIATASNTTQQIDVTDMSQGLYFIRSITSKGVSAPTKLVVNQ